VTVAEFLACVACGVVFMLVIAGLAWAWVGGIERELVVRPRLERELGRKVHGPVSEHEIPQATLIRILRKHNDAP
jgi:hypothetical protein